MKKFYIRHFIKAAAALVLALAMLAGITYMAIPGSGLNFGLKAEAQIISGTCGDGLTWTVDDTGTLTVSGSGALKDGAFVDAVDAGCFDYGKFQSVRTIAIEEGITSIEYGALYYYYDYDSPYSIPLFKNVEFITLPSSVQRIEKGAFRAYYRLTGIKILNPDCVIEEDDAEYYEGTEYDEDEGADVVRQYQRFDYTIPKTAVIIGLSGSTAEAYAQSFGRVFVGDASTGYGDLQDIVIASGECGDDLDWTLTGGGRFTVSGTGDMWDYTFPDTYPTDTPLDHIQTGWGPSWFAYTRAIKEVVIEEGVTGIGAWAFPNELEYDGVYSDRLAVVLPDSITSVSPTAFVSRTIETLNIPAGLTDLSFLRFTTIHPAVDVAAENPVYTSVDGALYSKDLTELVFIPSDTEGSYEVSDTVTMVKSGAFLYCVLENITFPESVTAIEEYAVRASEIGSITICNPSCEIDGDMLDSSYRYENMTVYGVSGSTAEAFAAANGLTFVNSLDAGTDPEIVAEGVCGENATWKLDSTGLLTISGTGAIAEDSYVYQANGTAWRGGYVYYTRAVIEEGITSIPNICFCDCNDLVSIDIPASVTSIGECAFPDGDYSDTTGQHAPCMTAVNVAGDNPAYASVDGVLFSKDLSELIYYPVALGTEYVIPNDVKRIGDYGFRCCETLTSVTIPNSVTSIGQSAFDSCVNLTSVNIPDSVTSIGESAFYGCSGLTSVNIPDSVTSIGDCAFSFCTGLTSVTIPYSVTSIGVNSFSYCTGLTSVTIHDGLPAIGAYAFSECTGLTSITIPYSVKSIEEYAFNCCDSLADVYYEGTEEEWDRIDINDNYYWGNLNLLNAVKHFIDPYSLGVTVNVNGIVQKYSPTCGLKFKAVIGDCDEYEVTDKGIAILGEDYYSEYDTEEEILATAQENGILCRLSDGTLTRENDGRYSAVIENLTEVELYHTYFAIPFAIVNGRWTIIGEAIQSHSFIGYEEEALETLPGDLRATATSSTSINLTWEAAPKASGYVIYRSDSGIPGTYAEIGSTTLLSFTDTGLWFDRTYYYTVAAFRHLTALDDFRIVGEQTEPVSATTVAVGDFLYWGIAVTDTTAKLYWQPVEGAASYDILRSDDGVSFTNLSTVSDTEPVEHDLVNFLGETFAYLDEGLTFNKTYYYKIAARDEDGVLLVESFDWEATTRLAAPQLNAVSASYNSVKLTWDQISGATGYIVYRFGDWGETEPTLVKKITKASTTAYTDGSLQCGDNYIYYVVAYKTVNKEDIYSCESEYIEVTPVPATPARPSAAVNLKNSTIKLTWKTVAGANGYEIESAYSSDGMYFCIGETNTGKAVTYTDTVYDGDPRFYRVRAYVDTAGGRVYSEASDYISASVVMCAPSVRLLSSTYNSAKIGWDKVTGASGYEVWRSEDGGDYQLIATISKGATVSYNNTKLTTGTVYSYKVLAFTVTNKVRTAESDFSNIVEITPSLAVPANFKVVRSGYMLKASWSGVSGAAGYELYRSDNGGEFRLIATTAAKTKSYSDGSVNRGIQYTYKVRAIAANTCGGFSEEISMTSTLAAPGGFSAKASGCDTINLKWSKVAGATGYSVYRSKTQNGVYHLIGSTDGNTAVTYSDRNVDTGVRYYYVVKAKRSFGGTIGYSACSAIKNAVTTLAKPGSVTLKKTGTGTVQISWNESVGADGYEIYRSDSKNGTYTLVGSVSGSTFTDSGLRNKATYYYKIRAYRKISTGKAYSDYVQKSISIK